jgi:hypothetical protein
MGMNLLAMEGGDGRFGNQYAVLSHEVSTTFTPNHDAHPKGSLNNSFPEVDRRLYTQWKEHAVQHYDLEVA